MRILRALWIILCLAQPAVAQDSDSKRPVVRGWEAAVIAGLTAGTMLLDQQARHLLRNHSDTLPGRLVRLGNAFGNGRYVMPALAIGALGGEAFGAEGVKGVSMRALESTALATAAVLVFKSALGRRRPDVDPHTQFSFRPFAFTGNSFPSGHTAIAFALATSLASETKDHWTDALFYGAGALTAFARISSDKHWLSDTVFGAAVGIISARLVRRWQRDSPSGPVVASFGFSF